MRILVLGAAGMLGHKVVQVLQGRFDVWGASRTDLRRYDQYAIYNHAKLITQVDVYNLDSVVDAIGRSRPEVVVNCVGIIKQVAEAHDAVASLTINALFPHRLQRLCKAVGARLIHISTDCVFRGDRGGYTEDEPSDALDLYGRSKFLGEVTGDNALTLRTSIIGRELSTSAGLVEWFLSQKGQRVEGYKTAIYSGLTTITLADVIGSIIADHQNLTGVWQVSSHPINKHDLLVMLRDAYGVDIDVVPSDRVQIDRSLDGSRFTKATGWVAPSWPQMIEAMSIDPTPYDRARVGRDRISGAVA